MKHFAIGDVHGCALTLDALLKTLPIEPEDKVIFLGDYIDRGPRSYDALEMVKKYLQENPHWVALLGNHEDMAFDCIGENTKPENELWDCNGGWMTKRSLHKNGKSIADYKDFISARPLFYETDQFIFAHAGINGTTKMSKRIDFLWERNARNQTKKTLIIGHSIINLQEIEIPMNPKIVKIDNGCFLGSGSGDKIFAENNGLGNLIAFCPETDEIFIQECID